jgi:hypothetical protein
MAQGNLDATLAEVALDEAAGMPAELAALPEMVGFHEGLAQLAQLEEAAAWAVAPSWRRRSVAACGWGGGDGLLRLVRF